MTVLKYCISVLVFLLTCKFEQKKALLIFDLAINEEVASSSTSTTENFNTNPITTTTQETVATPTFFPVGGTYNTDQNIVISTTTTGASIYYTTDGSVPTTSSTLYSSPVSIAGNGTTVTIKAIAVKSGMLDSAIASDTWTIIYNQVASPVFSPAQGHYTSPQTITISTSTPLATLYYTTDGSTPTTSSTLYTSGIHIWHLAGKILKAFGVKTGLLDSNVASATYSYFPLKTNQTNCWDIMGNPLACGLTRQDGDLQMGITRSYTDNGDGTITDNTTGLIWQKCSIGQTSPSCTGTASTFQWSSAASQCTSLTLAGKTWRLPNVEELQTLVDYGNNNPAIDTTYFPNNPTGAFWTISEHAPSFNIFAWFVSFQYGDVAYSSKTNNFYIRCVSGLEKEYSPNFTDNGDGTITDNTTGLIWQKCSWGQTNDATCSGTALTTHWSPALAYCNTLTLAGRTWRLPNVNELFSLLHKTKSTAPLIEETTYFPNIPTMSPYYWSSTSYLNYTASAWSTSFGNGATQGYGKTFNLYTRCVSDP